MSITIQLSTNLAALSAQLQFDLQKALNLVAVGLHASEAVQKAPFSLPKTAFFQQFAPNDHWTAEHTACEWERWVLRNGFRDVSELIASFLENGQKILANWHLVALQRTRKLIGADWNEVIVSREKKFHRLGLPEKLDFLQKHYSFVPADASLVRQVFSINAARNCLVHRNGVVGTTDITENDKFILEWTALAIIVQKDGIETQVVPPATVEAGSSVGIGNRPRRKDFGLGEPIVVDSREFSEICWTLSFFGSSCARKLEQHGRDQGIKFTDPETPAQGA